MTLLLIPPVTNTPFIESAPIKDQHNVKLGCNKIADAGVYTFRIIDAGKTEYVPARYTFEYENRDGEWLIAHHHSSLMP